MVGERRALEDVAVKLVGAIAAHAELKALLGREPELFATWRPRDPLQRLRDAAAAVAKDVHRSLERARCCAAAAKEAG